MYILWCGMIQEIRKGGCLWFTLKRPSPSEISRFCFGHIVNSIHGCSKHELINLLIWLMCSDFSMTRCCLSDCSKFYFIVVMCFVCVFSALACNTWVALVICSSTHFLLCSFLGFYPFYLELPTWKLHTRGSLTQGTQPYMTLPCISYSREEILVNKSKSRDIKGLKKILDHQLFNKLSRHSHNGLYKPHTKRGKRAGKPLISGINHPAHSNRTIGNRVICYLSRSTIKHPGIPYYPRFHIRTADL